MCHTMESGELRGLGNVMVDKNLPSNNTDSGHVVKLDLDVISDIWFGAENFLAYFHIFPSRWMQLTILFQYNNVI